MSADANPWPPEEEEEWTVAKRRGIPILVFRKLNVDLDDAQMVFARRVKDYVTGRFRGCDHQSARSNAKR